MTLWNAWCNDKDTSFSDSPISKKCLFISESIPKGYLRCVKLTFLVVSVKRNLWKNRRNLFQFCNNSKTVMSQQKQNSAAIFHVFFEITKMFATTHTVKTDYNGSARDRNHFRSRKFSFNRVTWSLNPWGCKMFLPQTFPLYSGSI
jgi:hypothetical protein